MRRIAAIALVVLVAAGGAYADYVSYYGVVDLDNGYYRYDYQYHNPGGALDLTPNVTTWTLEPVVGLDDEFATSAGAVYWDSGTFVNDNRGVMWTYLGTDPNNPDDTGQETYGIFQVTVYHPSGHTGDVGFTITDPNESGTITGPTPEPATLSLCLLGLGALVARKRFSG
jgi:hypothetical protein